MFIIKMKHVGKDGTYTIQEESATDESWAGIKYRRMLQNWHGILCRHVKLDQSSLSDDNQLDDMLLKVIQLNLSILDNGSTFEISKEEIVEV